MNKKNNKGFTLAEMLIVVAIIGVLIAIMIPTMTSQLEKAREATDAANIRSKISELSVYSLQNAAATSASVTLKQTTAGWESISEISGIPTTGTGITIVPNVTTSITVNSSTDGAITLN